MEPLRALKQASSVVEGREIGNCTIKSLGKTWEMWEWQKTESMWAEGFYGFTLPHGSVTETTQPRTWCWRPQVECVGTWISSLIPVPDVRNVLLACSFPNALHIQRALCTNFFESIYISSFTFLPLFNCSLISSWWYPLYNLNVMSSLVLFKK